MSKILHQRFIDALLTESAQLTAVRLDLLLEIAEDRKAIDDGYQLARMLRKALQSPDEADRRAAVAFLKEMERGENDEN